MPIPFRLLIPGPSLNVPVNLVAHGEPKFFFGAWDVTQALGLAPRTADTDLILRLAISASASFHV
jgi:hypothetical protein